MTKKINVFSALLLPVLIFSVAGCVTKTDFETLQLERRQDLNRIKQLENELAETKSLLQDEIEQSQTPVRQRTADMWAELQGLRTDIAKLRGNVDTLNIRLDRQVGPAQSDLTLGGLDSQLDEIVFILENELQVDMAKVKKEAAANPGQTTPEGLPEKVTVGEPTPVPATTPPAEDADPAKALYDKAYALYKEGEFEKARSYWAEFTDTFKGHPFSASAFFWQGQCYFKLKDYARAAILFEDVIERFKKSSKYKSALLKAGYCWDYLKKPELAKLRMEQVINQFPKSVEATQAKRFLEKNK
ncbi:Cell division coordinator CpoB [Pseudodesulfovibrio profundus]|uniref:Cell division coordinator CpoB n=1 Tax=Pseudodesulfovibrio profundus TaxID=57320 RepID=A0A2C8F514_9BACT|nr:tetratricopeptide repeat protein [Pseudodesulfovibrio profundus]SOB57691.1 Cell division coordinator CpoB [Pseudodesulfovibrio profundus]